ncbi:MAG: redoxin family protein [Phycisphaera sp.]|nr:redoxin family protein [Phycisphaera sp.]
MRNTLLTLAATALLGLAAPAHAQAPAAAKESAKPAAKATADANAKLAKMLGSTLIDSKGKEFETAKVLEGRKNVLVYFTASWCGPCKRFTPELVKFADQNKDAKDFVIIMVGSDRTAKAQNDYMKKAKMPFYAVPFESPGVKSMKTAFAGRGIPNLVIVDENGKALKGSYEKDGRYSPEDRNSYIGPQPVLASFREMQKKAKTTKG